MSAFLGGVAAFLILFGGILVSPLLFAGREVKDTDGFAALMLLIGICLAVAVAVSRWLS